MDLTDVQKNVMMTVFYLGKLTEFGLIEGDGPVITTKGFDVALDIYEEGYRVPKDGLTYTMETMEDDTSEDTKEMMVEMMWHMQTVGLKAFKEQVEEIGNRTQ